MPAVQRLMAELDGIADQIQKGHFLNVHFRAFRLAYDAWQEHVLANAVLGSRHCHSPGGAVLDNERDGAFFVADPPATDQATQEGAQAPCDRTVR